MFGFLNDILFYKVSEILRIQLHLDFFTFTVVHNVRALLSSQIVNILIIKFLKCLKNVMFLRAYGSSQKVSVRLRTICWLGVSGLKSPNSQLLDTSS